MFAWTDHTWAQCIYDNTLFCFRALFSFIWGQSFPVNTDLISETGTGRKTGWTQSHQPPDRRGTLRQSQGHAACFLKFISWNEAMWRKKKILLTLVTKQLERHFPLRWLIQVSIVQHFVIQRKSAEPELFCENSAEHSNQLTINNNRVFAAVKQKTELLLYLPCLRRFPSLRKQLPSQSRFSRCCLMSSRISGRILSRSSLQHNHSMRHRKKHTGMHLWSDAVFVIIETNHSSDTVQFGRNINCCYENILKRFEF